MQLTEALTRDERATIFRLAREISRNAACLEERWASALRSCGLISAPPRSWGHSSPKDFLAAGGGFRIRLDEALTEGISDQAIRLGATARNGWIYLRGYSYYAADPAMHLPTEVPAAEVRWGIIEGRWTGYTGIAAALGHDVANPPLSWNRWLIWISFLEMVVNDLCSATWTARQLRAEELARQAESTLDRVSLILAESTWNLWRSPSGVAPETWAARAADVLEDRSTAQAIRDVGKILRSAEHPPWTVRAVREGDILWQVGAAYERCWDSILRSHPENSVLLVSEAFGALAVGALWKAMMPAFQKTLVTGTISRSSVHEEEMGRVPGESWHSHPPNADGKVVVHLDDSVFTGRTHQRLRSALSGTPVEVYLVPLTFDVGTPFNHPDEVRRSGLSMAQHLHVLENLVRAPGGQLPAATSLWARRKRPTSGRDAPSKAEIVSRVTGGSDRLMAILWRRFMTEICHA